ncbi:MAG: hypothetical protein ABIQ18_35410 [Umezawaea sp.]
MTAVLDTSAELQEQARQAYRDSVASGTPLSRAALGERFDRSESWARDRIAEVRRADDNRTDIPAADEVPVDGEEPAGRSPAEPSPVAVDGPVMTTPVADMPPTATPAVSHLGARLMAWFGFAFGSLVSVAANVLAAWLPAGDNPPGWSPSIATQVGAAVWPVALLVSVEVMSRTAWRAGWHWTLVRIGGVGVVALGSGVISYGHIHAVLIGWGYDRLGAGVGPLVIDGLMVVSGFALLAMSDTNSSTERSAR